MLIFTKRLFDVFDDELNRIVQEIGGPFMPRTETAPIGVVLLQQPHPPRLGLELG
jgi:hypothetical protein